MKHYFILGIAFMMLIAATPAIQSVIFKPQKPKKVFVKTFKSYYRESEEIGAYISDACSKGWILKSCSITYRHDVNEIFGIVVFEAY